MSQLVKMLFGAGAVYFIAKAMQPKCCWADPVVNGMVTHQDVACPPGVPCGTHIY